MLVENVNKTKHKHPDPAVTEVHVNTSSFGSVQRLTGVNTSNGTVHMRGEANTDVMR